MKQSILFIADSSILNPILHSQGLPLLNYLTKQGYSCHFISFEGKNYYSNRSSINISSKKFVEELNAPFSITLVSINTKFFPGWLSIYVKGLFKALQIVKKNNIEIIHSRSFSPSIIALSLKLFFKPSIKFLYDNRGVYLDEEVFTGNWKKGGIKIKLARKIEELILNKSDSIVVVSNAFKKYLIQKFFSIQEKIFVIPNRTKIEYHKELNNQKRLSKKKIGIYSGSAAKWQRVPELSKLINLSLKKNDNISFEILTYEKDKFEVEFEKKSLKGIKVVKVDSDQVFNHLSQANFGILLRENNLINNVASPLKFAEYLAAGLPVLLSEGIGDTEEIVEKYNVGVIIHNQNYLKALNDLEVLLSDKNLKNRCFNVANELFNIKDSFIQYEKIYENILNRG